MKRWFTIEVLFLIPIIIYLGFFELYPLFTVGFRSLHTSEGQFTWEYYRNIIQQPLFRSAILNSLLFATVSSLVGAIGGTIVGYYAPRLPKAARSLILSIYALPNTISGLVVAFGFIVLLGRNGVLNLIVQRLFGLPRSVYFNIYSWPGLVVVYAFFMIPLMTLTMAAVFANLDFSLVEAARNLGAKPVQVWRYVIIPVLAPGFIAGLSIQFAAMLSAFGTVLALVGIAKNLVSIQIYSYTSESTYNLAQADALSIVLILIISIVLLGLGKVERRLRPN